MWGALEMKCIHVLYAGVTYSKEGLSLLLAVPVHVIHCDTLFLSQCRLGHLDVVQYLCADAGCDRRVRTRTAGHHFTLLASECMQLLHLSLSASYLYLINRLSSL